MITYGKCGHTRDWCDGSDIHKGNYCPSCREARIGTEIAYVRFGVPVERSTNWADGTSEAGMSVYEIGVGTIRSEFLTRKAYVGKGVIVGYGSDDEPLVVPVSCRRATATQRAKYGWA